MNFKSIFVLVTMFAISGLMIPSGAFAEHHEGEMAEETMAETTMTEESAPGSDRDEHGCIPSAGYSWSEEKQECVRAWEESNDNISEIFPLRFQIEFNDPSEEIKCRNDLVKLYKNNGQIICVNTSSVQKLIDRNVASEEEPDIVPTRMGAGTNGGVCNGKPNKSWQGAAYGYCLTKAQKNQLKGFFADCLNDRKISFSFKLLTALIKGGVGWAGDLAECGIIAQDRMGLHH